MCSLHRAALKTEEPTATSSHRQEIALLELRARSQYTIKEGVTKVPDYKRPDAAGVN